MTPAPAPAPRPSQGGAEGTRDQVGGEGHNGAGGSVPFPMCGGHGCIAILDTGSNIIAGPTPDIRALSLRAGVRQDCSNLESLPDLTFKLGDVHVSIPGRAYVMKVKMPMMQPVGGEGGGEGSGGLWMSALEEFQKRRGFALGGVLAGLDVDQLPHLTTLCMPAFVTLDQQTADGPAWILGTPLYEKYYARWSWAYDDPSPKIFIRELEEAESCVDSGDGWVNWHGPPEGVSSAASTEHEYTPGGAGHTSGDNSQSGSALMRRAMGEGGKEPEQASRIPSGTVRGLPELWERELDEIRYPEWARDLKIV